ncbi:MAG: hypothetical protein ACKPBU_16835 [Alphaproteobacteria bacterium]
MKFRGTTWGFGLAAGLLSLPLLSAPAQAIPICNNGADCRTELIADCQGMIAALVASVPERDRRSPIQDLNEAIRRFQDAPAKEAITYCVGAAKEDDRALKKMARAVKSVEKLTTRGIAPAGVAVLNAEMTTDIITTVTANADELEAILGTVTSQLETCRSRIAKANEYFSLGKLGKSADSAQRGYDSIRDPGCESGMRSCTTSFTPDLIDSDVDNSTDLEFTPSPEAASCKAEVLRNDVVFESGEITPCEADTVTLDWDLLLGVGFLPGDTLTYRFLRSNDTVACSATLTLAPLAP